MKGQGGFAALQFVLFLPLLLAATFCLYLFLSFSSSHIEMTQTCLREQIKTQENVKNAIRSLLKLNPQALRLRTQYKMAQVRYAAALTALNPAAAAAAQAQMRAIHIRRQLLDLHQKAIINMTNAQIAGDQRILATKLAQISERHKRGFESFMINEVRDLKFRPIQLAVIADDQGLGPTYSLSRNFIEDQALEFTWELTITSQNGMAHFLAASGRFLQSCSTTINSKEKTWPTVHREVKSSWKRLSSSLSSL